MRCFGRWWSCWSLGGRWKRGGIGRLKRLTPGQGSRGNSRRWRLHFDICERCREICSFIKHCWQCCDIRSFHFRGSLALDHVLDFHFHFWCLGLEQWGVWGPFFHPNPKGGGSTIIPTILDEVRRCRCWSLRGRSWGWNLHSLVSQWETQGTP